MTASLFAHNAKNGKPFMLSGLTGGNFSGSGGDQSGSVQDAIIDGNESDGEPHEPHDQKATYPFRVSLFTFKTSRAFAKRIERFSSSASEKCLCLPLASLPRATALGFLSVIGVPLFSFDLIGLGGDRKQRLDVRFQQFKA